MKHIVEIWTKNKDTNRIIGVRTRIELTDTDIEELALTKFKERFDIDDHIEYSASIDKTVID